MKNDSIGFNFSLSQFFRKNYLIIILLTLLVFFVYSNSLVNGFVSDDVGQLSFKSWPEKINIIFSDPLGIIGATLTSILYSVCGNVAGCVRFPNLLLHLINTLLIFTILSLISNKKIATFTSILFSIHPLLSETVDWISAQSYLVYTTFFLLSFLFYIIGSKKPRLSIYFYLSIAFSLLAFFATRRIFAFPIIIFYELIFGDIKARWKRLLPFIILSIIWLPLQFVSIGNQAEINISANGNNIVTVSLFIQIPLAITTYLNLFIFPSDLTFYHSKVFISNLEVVIRWVILLVTLTTGLVLFWKKKILLFAYLFFLFSVLIYTNPFGTNWVVAERYVYFGSIGLFVIVGYIFAQLLKYKRLYYPTIVVFSILVLVLGIRTIVRNTDWRNEDSLFIAVGKVIPNDPRSLVRQGNMASRNGDFEKAKEYYEEAIKSNSGFPDAYFNLGNNYKDQGDLDTASKFYQKTIELDPQNWQALQNIAIILYQQKKVQTAIDYINKAIKANPKNDQLYNNLGIIYLEQGEKDKAHESFGNAIKLNPGNESAQAGFKQTQ